MNEIVRAGALRGLRELATELGGDGDTLLREAGIDPAALSDGDSYVPFRSVTAVTERAAVALNCSDLGLRMAQRVGADMLGPLAVVMYTSESLREALTLAQRYFHFHNPSLAFSIVPHDAAHDFLCIDLRMRRPPVCPQTFERGIATLHVFLRTSYGAAYAPKEVWFTHAPLSPLSKYRAVFGVTPRFGAPHSGVIAPIALLDAPMAGSNARVKRIAQHLLDNAARPAGDALAPRARVLIVRLLRVGECAQADLAGALGLHERTLQRRLQAEGTTFEALRDEVRRELAQGYLRQSSISLARIAEMLGYAEPSAFTRACQRWFGKTPRDVRRRLSHSL